MPIDTRHMHKNHQLRKLKYLLAMGLNLLILTSCSLDASIESTLPRKIVDAFNDANNEPMVMGQLVTTTNDFEIVGQVGESTDNVTTSNDFLFEAVTYE